MKQTQILIVLLLFLTTGSFGQSIINFNGVVKDTETGNKIEGINVLINERNTGTITNETGEFFFFIQGGTYNITFSAEGYETKKIIVTIADDYFAEISLSPSDVLKKKNDSSFKRRTNSFAESVTIKPKLKSGKSS